MSNAVKLKGFKAEPIEQFKHDGGTWSFWVEVYEATPEEMAESYQRLRPSEVREYLAGDLNLWTVRVLAYIDGAKLGAVRSNPVWIKGQTLQHGKLRTEGFEAMRSGWWESLKLRAIQSGMACLAEILGQLQIGDARAEVERRAGIR